MNLFVELEYPEHVTEVRQLIMEAKQPNTDASFSIQGSTCVLALAPT
ncbi:MAG: hypothetical protein K2X55_11930 [Burkholderiaceae bacterium]|nr:hypothetical protein [Burkholderiaceae bacterium]